MHIKELESTSSYLKKIRVKTVAMDHGANAIFTLQSAASNLVITLTFTFNYLMKQQEGTTLSFKPTILAIKVRQIINC